MGRMVIRTTAELRTTHMQTLDRALPRATGRLEVADLELRHAFASHRLDDATLRVLRYMHDIESHTACYLRDVLVTKAHADPTIAEFLTIWNYEEHWHGIAIAEVLAAHGEIAGNERVAQLRATAKRGDRLRPLAFMIGSATLPDIVAVQMSWGAINEWTTQAGYAQLAHKADHPVLSELLRRIMRQEGTHIDFYRRHATERLAASRGAQRTTRFALKHLWRPVGTGVRPIEESRFVIQHLFGGRDGDAAIERIDRRIDRLPGQSGLCLMTQARAAAMAA